MVIRINMYFRSLFSFNLFGVSRKHRYRIRKLPDVTESGSDDVLPVWELHVCVGEAVYPHVYAGHLHHVLCSG